MFISDTNMCNISPIMNNVIDNQPVKNIQDLKPFDISSTGYETNKESTSELGVCIVLGVFRGWVNDIYSVITCI